MHVCMYIVHVQSCSLIPRLSSLAYTRIACFYYLTFDLALAQKTRAKILLQVSSKVKVIARGESEQCSVHVM